MAKYNALAALETMRQQLALCKQFLEQNDKTNFQATSTSIGNTKTALDAAISAETNINRLQGLE